MALSYETGCKVDLRCCQVSRHPAYCKTHRRNEAGEWFHVCGACGSETKVIEILAQSYEREYQRSASK